jgi:tRNA G46 methylase TrmB
MGFGVSVNRDSWAPPDPPARRNQGDVPGAMGGSRLWELPAQQADREALERFVRPGPPLAVEIGFDHGITLLSQARAYPGWRWLGVELRERRVAAVQAHTPENCLALRADGRTLFANLLPPGRVQRVDLLFPTPAVRGRHLLLTPALVDDMRRCLAPTALVHLRTDVPGMAELADKLWSGWPAAPPPPPAAELSRRERVCRRDGLPVYVRCFGRPSDDT